jgi:hypothetical protein
MPPTTSNPNFDEKPPEGSRDTVDEALERDKGAAQGITNKPAAEEQRQQEKLPPRGEAKKE